MATENVPTPPGMSDEDWADLKARQIKFHEEKSNAERVTAQKEEREREHAADFRTDVEGIYARGGWDDTPAAVIFNPAATPLSIAVAAEAKADCLRKSLVTWSLVDSANMPTVSEVACTLEPLAQEVALLVGELSKRLARIKGAAT